MAASYDPNPDAPNGFNLPFDLNTGQRIEKRWQAWLKHDPINLVRKNKARLAKLRGSTLTAVGRINFTFTMDPGSCLCSCSNVALNTVTRNFRAHIQVSTTGWI